VSASNPYDEVIIALARLVGPMTHRERIAYLRSQRIPRFIYKFRAALPDSNRSMQDILWHSKLWLSSPADFNDPFDTAAKLIVDSTPAERRKRFDEMLERQGVTWTKRQKEVPRLVTKPLADLEKLAQEKSQENAERTGICSFAGDPLNILMWSHYASQHRGVCLQFDVARDSVGSFMIALPVSYSEDYPVINWVTEFDKGAEKSLLRKHLGWSYERERRIIVLERARQPYSFQPEALTGIIIGCRADEGPIFKLVEERVARKLPKPRLYRAMQDDRKYRLKLKPLYVPF
jgi:hypothetical protein